MAKFIKLFCVTGLGLMMLCLFSCEQKQEPVQPKPQVKVVKKTIDTSKRADVPKNAVAAKVQPTGKQGVASIDGAKTTIPHTDVAAENQVGQGTLSVKPDQSMSGIKANSQSAAVTEKQVKTELAAVATSMMNALTIKKYDNMGRVDPFIPLLREKTNEPDSGEPEEKKPKRILTPLEKMDLSQIKLVAVVEMKNRRVAMVEEASGKGYEVEIGTYMGRHEGRVSAITSDGIEVKEYVKDFKGTRRERIQEIKFHKDEGGE